MEIFDYNFFYRYSVRTLSISKYSNIQNYLSMPFISKILSTFPLKHLEDVDEVQVYNYLYLFKFFLGRRASPTRSKSLYNLGK